MTCGFFVSAPVRRRPFAFASIVGKIRGVYQHAFRLYQQIADAMALTDVKIRSLKLPVKLVKLSDGGGLQLHVYPNGQKHWRMAYRFSGKQRSHGLGSYPQVSLAMARRLHAEAKDLLALGQDPAAARREAEAAKAAESTNTFGAVAAEFLAKRDREGLAAVSKKKTEWLLSFALVDLKDRPIADVSAADVLAVLRKVEARGRHESARRLRAVIGQVFRYGIATARTMVDPTVALQGALTTPTVKHRAAVLEPVAFGALLRAIDSFEGQSTTRAGLQLMALLFVRPGELRFAKWPEFDFENRVWTIPAARMKMRRDHRVPLAEQSMVILRDLRAITGRGKDGFVFPSVRTVTRPMSENTLNAALRRLGYDKDDATAHGFRATATTLLNESGKWSIDAIERAMSHADRDAVRRAYNRGEFWEERVKMAGWWADELDRLRALQPKKSAS